MKMIKRTIVFFVSVFLGAGLAYASNVSEWSTAAASNNSAPPNGAPEGMAPSGVNDVIRENMSALARWYSDSDGTLVTAGAGNTYTLTTNSAHTALNDVPLMTFRVDRANTGAATLNVDALGAKSWRANGSALESGALIANTIVSVAYNATDDAFDLVNTWIPTSIPDGSLSSNVPLLNAANTFTGIHTLQSANVELRLSETGITADNGNWRIGANSEAFSISLFDDAWSASDTAIAIQRTGTTIDEIELKATLLDFIGNVDVSGALTLGTDLAVTHGGTGSSTASGARTNLGVAIGSDVQAYDAQLGDIAALAVTDGNFIVGNGSAWVAESGATARTSLGLGSLATESNVNNSDWSGTDLAVANGGTGASDAATARSNLGANDAANLTTGTLDDDRLSTAVSKTSFGSFLATWTGFTSSPTTTVRWRKDGNTVTLGFDGAVSATSNTTTFFDTAVVPADLRPTANHPSWAVTVVRDNGTLQFGGVQVDSAGTITFAADAASVGTGGGFTASGAKGFPNDLTITYAIF